MNDNQQRPYTTYGECLQYVLGVMGHGSGVALTERVNKKLESRGIQLGGGEMQKKAKPGATPTCGFQKIPIHEEILAAVIQWNEDHNKRIPDEIINDLRRLGEEVVQKLQEAHAARLKSRALPPPMDKEQILRARSRFCELFGGVVQKTGIKLTKAGAGRRVPQGSYRGLLERLGKAAESPLELEVNQLGLLLSPRSSSVPGEAFVQAVIALAIDVKMEEDIINELKDLSKIVTNTTRGKKMGGGGQTR